MFDFITDLDEYFCESYTNYDKICMLDGYVMPKMQTTRRLDNGVDYSYTLPANTMRLSLQKNKNDLLKQLKSEMFDYSHTFSFRPVSFFERFKRKKLPLFKDAFKKVLAKKNLTEADAKELVNIDDKVWMRICKGLYEPTENLIFSLSLACGFSFEDATYLMNVVNRDFDFNCPRDVVISYLLKKEIFNSEMIKAAFDEYKISNLYIKAL